MNMAAYKYCSVPLCKNTTLHNPGKLFIHVPKSKYLRKKWLNLARRDPKHTSDKSTIYFCEDHFNLPEDMENYMEYHVMKSVKQVRLKANSLPTKFSCQPNRLKGTAQSVSRSVTIKRQCIALGQEAEMALEDSVTSTPAGSVIYTARYLSEEASEARNKVFRKYRSDHSRKYSSIAMNEDILHNLLLSSDPLLSSIRLTMKKEKVLKSKELSELLIPDCNETEFIYVSMIPEKDSDCSDIESDENIDSIDEETET